MMMLMMIIIVNVLVNNDEQTTSMAMAETTYSPIVESKSFIIYTTNVIISLYLMVSNAISVIKVEINLYVHISMSIVA